MNTQKKSKVIVLLSLILFFFACSKENDTVLNQELQAETLLTSENSTVVSMTKATDVAAAFFSQLADDPFTKSNVTIASTEIIRDSKNNNTPMMYVVNYTGGGFVIVGATKDYYPILAYSDTNNFLLNEDMGGVEIWLEETREAIRKSESSDTDTKAQMHSLWREYDPQDNMIFSGLKTKTPTPDEDAFYERWLQLDNMMAYPGEYSIMSLSDAASVLSTDIFNNLSSHALSCGSPAAYTIVGVKDDYTNTQVGPYLTTSWSQSNPYDYLCSSHPAGCVTIAIAQIMRFHESPTSYTWSNTATTSIQTLIRDIQNKLGGSSATSAQAKAAFQYFGYNATLTSHNYSTVRNELYNNHKPIFMAGHPSSGEGHAWVCDGAKENSYTQKYFVEFLVWRPGKPYSSEGEASFAAPENFGNGYTLLYFNMNWGWGDASNGWFGYNDVNAYPSTPGYNFNNSRENIYVSK